MNSLNKQSTSSVCTHDKITVVIADNMDSGAETILNNMGITVDSRPARGEVELHDVIGGADGLLIRSATTVSEGIIAKASHLKAIGRAGIGVDNIDITAATAARIAVMNTPCANAVSTAEHALALMFAVTRLIPQAHVSTHDGKWEKNLFKGHEITGKNIGIIGCGNIGSIVAHRAKGLCMNVLVYDPFLTDERSKEYGVRKVTLDTLLKDSDIITLHTPLLDATQHILNAEAFNKMKHGVHIINAARGGLIDENALGDALDSSIVAGAALDVYQTEPMKKHPLCHHPRVIMTPHIAASTHEAQANVALQIAAHVGNYLRGVDAENVLNPSVL